MDKIKISICIPTRNRAGYIGTAIESVISQAGDNIEVVIIDGASTDNTAGVVRKYQQKFRNLIYFRQEINGGVDRDMAKAITLSRGEYCWLFSDDDALKPGAIERMVKEINLGCEIYLCNVTVCDLLLRPIRERFWLSKDVKERIFNLHEKKELIEYCNKADSIGALFSFWSSIILRREVWIKSGYDYDFDGSAYALAATLFSSISRGKCRLKYLRDSLVLWRNDNESFQNEGGLLKRFLLDFDGYLHLADKYLSFDSGVRAAFLGVMRREHPWYTIIHAVSYIDNKHFWVHFKDKLLRFGYGQMMVNVSYRLGRGKPIISIGVKIKRKIVKSRWLHKVMDRFRATIRRICLQDITMFNYLLVLNIFIGAFLIFRFPFEFYVGYIFIIWFLIAHVFRHRSANINSNFLIILVILTISSLANVYFGNDSLFFVTKQVLGILLTGSAYYLLVQANNYSIEKLFKIYLRIAIVVAAIGIFQEFSYLVKFKIGYDFSWMPLIRKWTYCPDKKMFFLRVNSIFMEPNHFAIAMAPAFFISFSNIFNKSTLLLKSKWASVIIVISYLLTFSAVAYIAIFMSLLLFYDRKKSMFIATLIPIFIFSAYILVPDIKIRINNVLTFVNHPVVTSNTHMSIYAIVSNAFIAFKSFTNNVLFGMGLGSHPISYDRFFNLGALKGFLNPALTLGDGAGVCKGDSGSLFLRLFSETGLFGVIVVFYFIIRFRFRNDNNNSLFVMNSAAFILFILVLLRQGHYFYNGLFFFVWIYYFSYKIYNKTDPKILVENK